MVVPNPTIRHVPGAALAVFRQGCLKEADASFMKSALG
jgi:hypothetical protein